MRWTRCLSRCPHWAITRIKGDCIRDMAFSARWEAQCGCPGMSPFLLSARGGPWALRRLQLQRHLPESLQASGRRISFLKAEGKDRTFPISIIIPTPSLHLKASRPRRREKLLWLFKDLPKLVVELSLGAPLPSLVLKLIGAVNC